MMVISLLSDSTYRDICYRNRSLSIWPADTLVHPAKATGRNETPFGRDTCMIPSNSIPDRATVQPHGKARFGDQNPKFAVMLPIAKLLWALLPSPPLSKRRSLGVTLSRCVCVRRVATKVLHSTYSASSSLLHFKNNVTRRANIKTPSP